MSDLYNLQWRDTTEVFNSVTEAKTPQTFMLSQQSQNFGPEKRFKSRYGHTAKVRVILKAPKLLKRAKGTILKIVRSLP
jgi:hypothetical protein